MASQCVVLLIFACVLFGSQQTFASPLSFNVSKAVNTVRNFPSKIINGAKTLLGFSPETTTINPPTTTKASLRIVLIPKGFTKKTPVSDDEITNSTAGIANATNPPTSSYGFIEKTKYVWQKAKDFVGLTKATTTKPPRNVLLVPVNWEVMRNPCQRGKNQGCRSTSQASTFSWWTLSLSLAGALLMGAAAWIVYTRNRTLGNPTLWEKVRPQKLVWWYTSKHNSHMSPPAAWYPTQPAPAISSRGPVPLPAPAGRKNAGSPPTIPAPPVPVPVGHHLCANSLYQITAVPGHVYATPTPTPTPYSGWASKVSEHVHVYEIPPCFPSYDQADQEIDTTTLKKPPNSTNQAKC